MGISEGRAIIERATEEIRERARTLKEERPPDGRRRCDDAGDLTGEITLEKFCDVAGVARFRKLHRLLLWRSPSEHQESLYSAMAGVPILSPMLFFVYRHVLGFHPTAIRIRWKLQKSKMRNGILQKALRGRKRR